MAEQELFYWLRIGDAGDYQQFDLDDEDSITGELAVMEVSTKWFRCPGGITMPGYTRKNYISLYVGDQSANRVRDLNDEEFAELKARYRKVRGSDGKTAD